MDWFSGLRILTVGDGDLSFSRAIYEYFGPASLTATTLEDAHELNHKYQQQELSFLTQQNIEVFNGFDVTEPQTWGELVRHNFDLTIFQFPLVPGTQGKEDFENGLPINTRNRQLLHKFLLHSQEQFLDPNGLGIAMITSKNVKPYTEWQIETSIQQNTNAQYLGELRFHSQSYPGYRLRNVDRDKQIKGTAATSYLWGINTAAKLKAQQLNAYIPKFLNHEEKYCALCHAGPFRTPQEQQFHHASKKHRKMLEFQQHWTQYLAKEYQ